MTKIAKPIAPSFCTSLIIGYVLIIKSDKGMQFIETIADRVIELTSEGLNDKGVGCHCNRALKCGKNSTVHKPGKVSVTKLLHNMFFNEI